MSEMRGGRLQPESVVLFNARSRERPGRPTTGAPELCFRPVSNGQSPVPEGGFLAPQTEGIGPGSSPIINPVGGDNGFFLGVGDQTPVAGTPIPAAAEGSIPLRRMSTDVPPPTGDGNGLPGQPERLPERFIQSPDPAILAEGEADPETTTNTAGAESGDRGYTAPSVPGEDVHPEQDASAERTLPQGNVAIIAQMTSPDSARIPRFLIEIGQVQQYTDQEALFADMAAGVVLEAITTPGGQSIGLTSVLNDFSIQVSVDPTSDTEARDAVLALYDNDRDLFTRIAHVPGTTFTQQGFDLNHGNQANEGLTLNHTLSELLYRFQTGQGEFAPADPESGVEPQHTWRMVTSEESAEIIFLDEEENPYNAHFTPIDRPTIFSDEDTYGEQNPLLPAGEALKLLADAAVAHAQLRGEPVIEAPDPPSDESEGMGHAPVEPTTES